jgi:predicted enzyme related to lactoylglutathione lyase
VSIKSIDMTWIVVSDLKKAVKYYTEVVGLKLHQFAEEYGWAELSGREGGSQLGLAQNASHCPIKPGQNGVFTLTVESIQEQKKRLAAKNVSFLGDVIEVPGHVRLLLCEDADGNKFQLVESLSEHQFIVDQ